MSVSYGAARLVDAARSGPVNGGADHRVQTRTARRIASPVPAAVRERG